jgi:hypothetical protein
VVVSSYLHGFDVQVTTGALVTRQTGHESSLVVVFGEVVVELEPNIAKAGGARDTRVRMRIINEGSEKNKVRINYVENMLKCSLESVT